MKSASIFYIKGIIPIIQTILFTCILQVVFAQSKKSTDLTPSEYQKQKVAGNLPNLFPKEFEYLKSAKPQPMIIQKKLDLVEIR